MSLEANYLPRSGKEGTRNKAKLNIKIETEETNTKQYDIENFQPQIQEQDSLFIKEEPKSEKDPLFIDFEKVKNSKEFQKTPSNQEKIEKGFKCKFCGRKFATEIRTFHHERIHIGKINRNKTRHEQLPKGEKPFSCNFCDMKFTLKYSKIRHERKHVIIT